MTKQSNIKKRKAVIYARVSSERQVDNMSLEGANNKLYNEIKKLMEDNLNEKNV